MSVDLGRSASRGAAVMLGGQGARMAIQFVGIVVLARLLSPADYGLVAMVMAIIGAAELLRDFGLASAAIQAKNLTRGEQDNLFWANTALGATVSLIVLASSYPLAKFYGDERIQGITAAMAVVYLMSGVSTQFYAHLTRSLQFGRLTTAEVVGQAAGLSAGVAFALTGQGYWSLVAQQVALALATLITLFLLTPWSPGWIKRNVSIRPFLRYGVNVLGANMLGYASRNADSVIIGVRLTPSDLGLYNRAYQLMMLPLAQINVPITRVALPVLSRLQDDGERYRAFLLFGQSKLLVVGSFVLAIVGAQASSVISVLLGGQWLPALPVFQILLVAGFFHAAEFAARWVFLSRGLTKANLKYMIATRPAMIALLVIGTHWGLTGVAVAYALGMALTWPISLLWISLAGGVPARQMFLNGVRTLAIFGTAAAVSHISTAAFPIEAHFLRLAVGLAVLVATLAFAALVWPSFRKDVVDLGRLRRHFSVGSIRRIGAR